MNNELFKSALWQFNLWGSPVYEYLLTFGIFLIFLSLFKLFQWFALKSLAKVSAATKTDLDNSLLLAFRTIKPPFYVFLAFYLSVQFLSITPGAAKVITIILISWVVYQAIVVIQILLNVYLEQKLQTQTQGSKSTYNLIHAFSTVVLWTLGLLFILQNVGVNVTSLMAGLGIGGIAIALAAQKVFGDLISSLAIYFDKPFETGEFIKFDDVSGTVQKVGIKTTRIKALNGEEIVIANSELINAKIQNFARLKRRRVAFSFGVTYETDINKLRQIPAMMKLIVQQQKPTSFERSHLVSYGKDALIFDNVYYVEDSDYQKFRDIHQQVLLGIKEKFEQEKITLTSPTKIQ